MSTWNMRDESQWSGQTIGSHLSLVIDIIARFKPYNECVNLKYERWEPIIWSDYILALISHWSCLIGHCVWSDYWLSSLIIVSRFSFNLIGHVSLLDLINMFDWFLLMLFLVYELVKMVFYRVNTYTLKTKALFRVFWWRPFMNSSWVRV